MSRYSLAYLGYRPHRFSTPTYVGSRYPLISLGYRPEGVPVLKSRYPLVSLGYLLAVGHIFICCSLGTRAFLWAVYRKTSTYAACEGLGTRSFLWVVYPTSTCAAARQKSWYPHISLDYRRICRLAIREEKSRYLLISLGYLRNGVQHSSRALSRHPRISLGYILHRFSTPHVCRVSVPAHFSELSTLHSHAQEADAVSVPAHFSGLSTDPSRCDGSRNVSVPAHFSGLSTKGLPHHALVDSLGTRSFLWIIDSR